MIKIDLKLTESVDWFKRNWRGTETLVLALIVAAAVSLSLSALLNFGPIEISAVLFGSMFFVWGAWGWLRRIPRSTPGKICFVVAINCDDDLRPGVRDDFVMALRTHVREGPSGDMFEFVELPQHFANKIVDQKDTEVVRKKMRAHFLLAGRVRRRKLEGKEKDVLNIIGIVAHAPTEADKSKQLSNEFTELLPSRVVLEPENSLPHLEFTAEWAGAVAKYVMGIAAAISRDFEYSKKMFSDARLMISRRDNGFLVYEKLKKRIPMHLAAIAQFAAIRSLNLWRETKQFEQIKNLGRFIDEAESEVSDSPTLFILRATHVFIAARDTKGAFSWLQKVPKSQRDGVWHLNTAFLKAYDGKLKEALQSYRAVHRFVLPHDSFDVIAQVEDFILWVYESEPDKVQMLYCLGYLNWKMKGDLHRARADLQAFINKCPVAKYEKECLLANEWLATIESELSVAATVGA